MPIKVVQPESQLFLKALIFGPHKHGKTSFCGSAQDDPRSAPALLLDFEGNISSLVGLPIDIVQVRSWEDFNEVYSYLKRGQHSEIPGSTLLKDQSYSTVAIDSITEVNFYALSEELFRQGSAGRGREAGPFGPDAAQIQDYGKVLTQMRRFLRRFRDLPMNVIYTALDDQEAEPGEGVVKTPAMIGAMKREVGALVDVVGYLAIRIEEKEKKRLLLLHDIDRFRVGVREEWKKWGSIPTTLENPTVGKLMDLVLPSKKIALMQKESA